VISKKVEPIDETSLDKLQLNLSSSQSLANLSGANGGTGQSDTEMKDD